MKVTETITRECCTDRDLKPVEGTPRVNNTTPVWKFCQHCGRRHEYDSFIAAVRPYSMALAPAGSRDWRYVPRLNAWEERPR